MQESIVSTGADVKFIGNSTPMTQANWQDYFSTFHKNGIIGYDDLRVSIINTTVYIRYGSVFVNGLLAKLDTGSGTTVTSTTPTQSEIDALFCLRVYLQEEKVELVRKTGLAAGTSYQNCADVVVNLMFHDHLYCTRDDEIYEIPIAYMQYASCTYFVDCRRYSGTYQFSGNVADIRGDGERVFGYSSGSDYYIDPFIPPKSTKLIFYPWEAGTFTNGFKYQYYFGDENSWFTTNIEPLVRNSVPIVYYYDKSDFTLDSVNNRITHTSILDAGEPVVFSIYDESIASSYYRFIITVQGK